MYLKIQRENGWYIVGEVMDFGYEIMKRNADFIEPLAETKVSYWSKDTDIYNKICIFVIRKNKSRINITTNETVYVCNEEGKTIEKLIVT